MIKALFVDIGGVLLTNGWDRNSRALACTTFGIDAKDYESRHALTFDVYEIGKISLEEYLKRTIFYTERPFSMQQFQTFMFEQSKLLPDMLDMLIEFKKSRNLRVCAFSNEGRELTEFRIKKFDLGRLFDFYVSSCFVHLRKPDPDIYKLALDLVQLPPQEVAYIDDRAFFVQVGSTYGLQAIHHTSPTTTLQALNRII